MNSLNAIISLIIWFAKFTDPIRDVTEIRRISAIQIAGYSVGWSNLSLIFLYQIPILRGRDLDDIVCSMGEMTLGWVRLG